ncbi:MAG: FecR domain-containing protein [Dysgonamonadaceae bacterium]|jgi:ferric-dicitrate binding protein FerR (iron transport regulator)|nr:FecR domain-containing protein [Dysgonamonadaceae bacterium]
MRKELKELINTHIHGRLNVEEREYLRQNLSMMSDDELTGILSDIWNKFEDKTTPENDFDHLSEKLGIIPQQKKTHNLLYWTRKAAAAILIPLIVGLSVYHYAENKKLNNFIANSTSIDVASGEKAQITLPDGTTVCLNAATTISYPSDFGLKAREIFLNGEAYLDVSKNEKIPFFVNTDLVQIKVLGTKFNVNAYSSASIIETYLVEGSIELTTKGAKPQSIILSPNEKAAYYKERDILSVFKTSTRFEMAWLRGELVFRSVQFSDIVEKLERRYGVKIQVMGDDYNKNLFTGNFKEDYIDGVLKILQLHYNFTYTKNGDEVQIRFE